MPWQELGSVRSYRMRATVVDSQTPLRNDPAPVGRSMADGRRVSARNLLSEENAPGTCIIENLELHTSVSVEPLPVNQLPNVPGYELHSLLGEGGMGVVYLATQTALKRPVALKMIASEHAGTTARERFQTEAETVARLRHPNFVQIYEVSEHEGRPFLALELVEGESLAGHLRRRSPMPARDAAQLVGVLAHAMHHAHVLGIVHRDLKPANILLQCDEYRTKIDEQDSQLSGSPLATHHSSFVIPKIADFGLAKMLDGDARRTRSGAILGTPSYMAPEQAHGTGRNITALTDVYALGAILYECLTGRPPFEGDTSWDVLVQVMNADPAPPSHRQPRLARDLDTICLKCLAKDPRRRYESAAALADDLDRFAAGEAISARPERLHTRLGRKLRGRPLTVAVTILLIGATFLGGAFWEFRRTSAENDLREGREQLRNGAFASARDRFQHGQHSMQGWPGCFDLESKLARELVRVNLRDLSDQMLFNYAPDHLDPAKLADLLRNCQHFWDSRVPLLAYKTSDDPEWEINVRALLRDLALRASQIEVRLAANDESRLQQARQHALKLLDELEEFSGPSKVLEVERIMHRNAPETLDQLEQPTSAAEYHQFGRAYWTAGKLDRAEQCFERGTIMEPRSLALHFDRASLAFQRGRYDEAAESFRACLAIQPNSVGYSRLAFAYLARAEVARKAESFRTGLAFQPYPFGYSWLGFAYLAHADLVRKAARDEDLNRAELNFTEAIGRAGQIDGRSGLAEALFGRAQVYHRRKDNSNALNDLTKALEAGYPRAKGLYTIAVVHLDAGNPDKAEASNKDALAAQPDFAPARDLLERLTKRPEPETP